MIFLHPQLSSGPVRARRSGGRSRAAGGGGSVGVRSAAMSNCFQVWANERRSRKIWPMSAFSSSTRLKSVYLEAFIEGFEASLTKLLGTPSIN